MSTLLGLREFTHLRWDPRILIVDAREKRFVPGASLDNPFFSWVRIGSRTEAQHLASDISLRHLIIVHEDEERALDLDHVLKGLELHSSALEAGERGWCEAILEEGAQMYGDVLVVTLNQLASNKRQYIFVHGGSAVAVQPSGSIAALREEVRHQSAKLEAVLDVTRDEPEGSAFARVLGAPYVQAPFEIGGMRIRRVDRNTLQLQTKQCFSHFSF